MGAGTDSAAVISPQMQGIQAQAKDPVSLLVSSSSIKNNDNTIGNIKVTAKTEPLVTVTNTIVEILRAEPGRTHTVSDIFHCTGSTREAVKMALSRLASPKNPAPVKRVGRGLYRYDPAKDKTGLTALIGSGNWKVENLVFVVTKGAHPPPLLPFLEPVICPEPRESNMQRQATPRPGYPWRLVTGQCVIWEMYENHTQVIRLSANGAQPFSPDHALTLIDVLRKDGLNDKWECKSIEANVDSRYLRVDASISLQILEGLLIKCYQHGSLMRVELADRRRCSLGEVMGLLNGLAGTVDSCEALQQCDQLRKDLKEIAGTAQVALSNSRKLRDRVDELAKPSKKKKPKKGQKKLPSFSTAAQLKDRPYEVRS